MPVYPVSCGRAIVDGQAKISPTGQPAGMESSAGTQVFRGSQARRAGEVTTATLRGPRWRRLFRDVYLPAGIPVDHEVCCRGAMLLLPPAGVVAGLSAAAVWGLPPPPELPVQVLVPPGVRFGPVRGIEVRSGQLTADDVTTVRGLRVTTPERTAWDLARRLDLADAVAVLDTFGRCGLVDRTALERRAEAAFGRRGSRRARIAIGLCDPRSGSPDESRLRVRLVLAGVPAPIARYEVRYPDGRVAGSVDLAWPQRRVALDRGLAATPDRSEPGHQRRVNRVVAAGWLLLHATPERIGDDWPGLVREVRTALGAAWR